MTPLRRRGAPDEAGSGLSRTQRERGGQRHDVQVGTPESSPGFSREDLEQIIRRASELQFEQAAPEGRELVGEAEILRVGEEVGLEARHLRRAVGELRAESLHPHPPGDHALLVRMMGPGFTRAARVVPGDATDVDTRLADHLSVGESLTRIRKRGDGSLWEPSGGMMAGLQRALKWRGFTYHLARCRSVELSVSTVGDGHTLVTMMADVRRVRTEAALEWILGLGIPAGIVAISGGALLGVPWLALPVTGAAIGLGTLLAARRFRDESSRTRVVMEGILDRLERGEPLASRTGGPWGSRASR